MSLESNLDKIVKEITEAGKIAKFYGFCPIQSPVLEKSGSAQHRVENENEALITMYYEKKLYTESQPVMFYCEKKSNTKIEASLVSLGSFKSVCECLTIQTGIAILNFLGYKNLEVEVNSIGDKESVAEFQRKLSTFIKKNFNSFSTETRQAVKKNIFSIFEINQEKMKNLETEIPKSIDFLSESSRLHFKEVLEFLEIMNIPYSINKNLMGNPEIGSETVFSIKEIDSRQELANGFRFNRLAKKMGYKKEVPSVLLKISAKLKKNLRTIKVKNSCPQFYLVQFGPEAKLKSFLILDELRKIGVSVSHTIAKDKLGSQMSIAENSEAPYILLIGQKEALENSVVIRHTVTRAQEIVSLAEFSAKIKELE